jgi:hypothetical protein
VKSNFIAVLAVSMLLVGCGGGGSSHLPTSWNHVFSLIPPVHAQVPAPLNFQVVDATVLPTGGDAWVLSAGVKDLDNDGYPEVILTLTGTNRSDPPAFQPVVIEGSGQLRLATSDFFPTGAPTVKNSYVTYFADVNGDGLQDIVFPDAGLDAPPWTGSRIGIALNLGLGKYRDVSSLVPADVQKTRSQSLAIGDIAGDGRVQIGLPDQNDGGNAAALRWNGSGFDEIVNWVPQTLWTGTGGAPGLRQQSFMANADFDRDGHQDLLVTGVQFPTPNLRILFGAAGGFTTATTGSVLQLPDGLFTGPGVGDNDPLVIADFNNDGWPDIFAQEGVGVGTPAGTIGVQVMLNQGARKFIDATAASWTRPFDPARYSAFIPIDINNDGFLDVVGLGLGGGWSLFLNDGTGAFQYIRDAGQLLFGATTMPQVAQGSLVPTVVNPRRTEAIVYQTVGGLGGCHPPNCTTPGTRLYKVVANGSIGTGPNLADSAALGVPGFNEFYYLRHYPDAAAAVQAGQFRTGLDHYIVVGAAKGYRRSAPNNAIPQGVSLWSNNKAYRATLQEDGNVVIYDTNNTPLWFTNTVHVSGAVFVMEADGNLVVRDGQNVVRWQSGTTGNPGAYFGLQDDGNLVIFSANGTPIWGAYGH